MGLHKKSLKRVFTTIGSGILLHHNNRMAGTLLGNFYKLGGRAVISKICNEVVQITHCCFNAPYYVFWLMTFNIFCISINVSFLNLFHASFFS